MLSGGPGRRHPRQRAQRALAATALLAGGGAAALSSCAPTGYDFELNLSGTCEAVAGLDGPGIEGSLCFVADGAVREEFGAARALRSRRRPGGREGAWRRVLAGLDASPQMRHARDIAQQRRQQQQEHHHHHQQQQRQQQQQQQQQKQQQQQLRRTQNLNGRPVVVTSVTFLEADATPQLNIINQDSTYFNVTAYDGDVLSFPSASAGLDPAVPLADQADRLVGGVLLVLIGLDAEGEAVRNHVAWGYDVAAAADDAVEPLAAGDGLGWVVLRDYAPPDPAFCAAVTASPTPGPSGLAEDGRACAADAACASGRCVAARCSSGREGQTCSLPAAACDEGLACVDGTCTTGLPDGRACAADAACASGRCVASRCSSGRGGQTCSLPDAACDEGLACVDGTCAAGSKAGKSLKVYKTHSAKAAKVGGADTKAQKIGSKSAKSYAQGKSKDAKAEKMSSKSSKAFAKTKSHKTLLSMPHDAMLSIATSSKSAKSTEKEASFKSKSAGSGSKSAEAKGSKSKSAETKASKSKSAKSGSERLFWRI